MYLLVAVLSFSLQIVHKINCFTFDTDFPIIYSDTLKRNNGQNTYFGYSVIMHPGNNANGWVQIGVPKGGTTTRVVEPGLVIRCYDSGVCSTIKFDEEHLNNDFYSDITYKNVAYFNDLSHSWIGVAMDINYRQDINIVCGHKWLNKVPKKNHYYALGICYWARTNDHKYTKIIPLLGGNEAIQTNVGSIFYYSLGQAGFSASLVESQNRSAETQLILGAPGIYNWKGSTIKVSDLIIETPEASKLRKRKYRDITVNILEDINVVNSRTTYYSKAFSLTGYSVGSGYFYGQKKLYYATSSPRMDYIGQVTIFDFGPQTETAGVYIDKVTGQQFGEYFGGSLTVGDINGDGADDLIIGAPFHKTKLYNEGCVYVYLGNANGKTRTLQKPTRGHTILGKFEKAQFGASMMFLGDFDLDGFGDVAIGAPYEDEQSGAVYIFRGIADGLDVEPAQKIKGRNVYQNLRGFGISFTKAVDMDKNYYSDIAVGSYLSGNVVMFRSMKPVTLVQTINTSVQRIDVKEQFNATICVFFQSTFPPENITVRRVITVDEQLQRGIILNTPKLDTTLGLYKMIENCETIQIKIKVLKNINLYSPFTISVSQSLIFNKPPRKPFFFNGSKKNNDAFKEDWPVYNSYKSIKTQVEKIPFTLGCRRENICEANLTLETKFTNVDAKGFTVGAHKSLQLQTFVKNYGENAYYTQVKMDLPKGIYFRIVNSTCETSNNTMTCFLDNRLETNVEKSLIFELEMMGLDSYEDNVIFNVTLLTSSENLNNITHMVKLNLYWDADMEINGKSDKETYLFNVTKDSIEFAQAYKIQKHGYSPIQEVSVEIEIPHTLNTENEKIKFANIYRPTFLDKQPLHCNSDIVYTEHEEDEAFSDDEARSEKEYVSNRQKRQVGEDVEVLEGYNISSEKNAEIKWNNDYEFVNRTFFINCSTPNIECSKLSCDFGPFVGISKDSLASLNLQIKYIAPSLIAYYKNKDIINYATFGTVKITNPNKFNQTGIRHDFIKVSSIFVDESNAQKVPLWIIILSVIAGILLLLLAILALMKMGFFKRAKKEELQELKMAQAENEFEQKTLQSMENLDCEE